MLNFEMDRGLKQQSLEVLKQDVKCELGKNKTGPAMVHQGKKQ